jgi:hypothetical protein
MIVEQAAVPVVWTRASAPPVTLRWPWSSAVRRCCWPARSPPASPDTLAGSPNGSGRRPPAQHHRLHRELAQRLPQAGEGQRTHRRHPDWDCGQTCKATRCRNRSLKWRTRSTSAPMNRRCPRDHPPFVVVAADVGLSAPRRRPRSRARRAASTCIPRKWADAYNDVHGSGSPATVDRIPRGAFNRSI